MCLIWTHAVFRLFEMKTPAYTFLASRKNWDLRWTLEIIQVKLLFVEKKGKTNKHANSIIAEQMYQIKNVQTHLIAHITIAGANNFEKCYWSGRKRKLLS